MFRIGAIFQYFSIAAASFPWSSRAK